MPTTGMQVDFCTWLANLTCSKFGETMCRSLPSALTASRSSVVSATGLCVAMRPVVGFMRSLPFESCVGKCIFL